MSFDPVTLATPFFILAIILEVVLARMGRTRTNYEPKDTAASLVMGLGSTLAGLLTGGLVAAATLYVYQHRLFDIPMTAVWAWVTIFLLEDMTYYWFHRLSHERRFWWAGFWAGAMRALAVVQSLTAVTLTFLSALAVRRKFQIT